ncbi:hypothetical protein D6851_02580 [Altericroceibacterium spongiae]|uniref:DUF3168 domain-containing protein n=1 Tax=Altericroceibacterium spongiae TaxID=2320269 RepID=A0A420ERP4_9SPHN|nr:hypothetical protein [Altericroceibacterium spongiae]RKF23376.1 hypothetical protein D6851_02580 [Altericroceibacterium spongiae]
MLRAMMIADLRSEPSLAPLLSSYKGYPAIFWMSRPARSQLPGVTLQSISSGTLYSQEGAAKLRSRRVQVDAWSLNVSSEAPVAFDAVRKVIERGFTDRWRGFSLDDERDTYEDLDADRRIFRTSGDFMIWYQET